MLDLMKTLITAIFLCAIGLMAQDGVHQTIGGTTVTYPTKVQFATNGTFAIAITNGNVGQSRLRALRSDGQTAEMEAQSFDVVNSSVPGTRVYYFDPNGIHANGFDTPSISFPSTSYWQVKTNLRVDSGIMLKTNYVAANFTPISGYLTIVASNRVLYGVSDTKTNVLLSLE